VRQANLDALTSCSAAAGYGLEKDSNKLSSPSAGTKVSTFERVQIKDVGKILVKISMK
jgi:hypothetical protein